MPLKHIVHEPRSSESTESMPRPGSPEVHLWLAFCDAILDSKLLAAYQELLSASERAAESRFHFAGDRQCYLVRKALLRSILSRYAPVAPKDWVFSTNAHGKPQIANSQLIDGSLSFNVSHTEGLV